LGGFIVIIIPAAVRDPLPPCCSGSLTSNGVGAAGIRRRDTREQGLQVSV